MHYSRHRLTASMAHVTTFTYASTNDHALHAHWSVHQKLNRVSSVQLRRSVRALEHTWSLFTRHPIFPDTRNKCLYIPNLLRTKAGDEFIGSNELSFHDLRLSLQSLSVDGCRLIVSSQSRQFLLQLVDVRVDLVQFTHRLVVDALQLRHLHRPHHTQLMYTLLYNAAQTSISKKKSDTKRLLIWNVYGGHWTQKWQRRIRNKKKMKGMQECINIVQRMIENKSKSNFFSRVCRMPDDKLNKQVLFGIIDGKNKRRRPKRRCRDDLVDWCNKIYRLAMDRIKWTHFLKYVPNTNGHWAHGVKEMMDWANNSNCKLEPLILDSKKDSNHRTKSQILSPLQIPDRSCESKRPKKPKAKMSYPVTYQKTKAEISQCFLR